MSVSTLTRSEVAVDPTDVPEAKDLAAWWAAEGSSASIEPLGQAGSSQGGSQGSGGQRQVWQQLLAGLHVRCMWGIINRVG